MLHHPLLDYNSLLRVTSISGQSQVVLWKIKVMQTLILIAKCW